MLYMEKRLQWFLISVVLCIKKIISLEKAMGCVDDNLDNIG